jgi:hypothetical protein
VMISSTRGNLKQKQVRIEAVKSLGGFSSVDELVRLLHYVCNFVW